MLRRNGTLLGLAVFVAAACVACGAPPSPAGDEPRCGADEAVCDGACVDVESDPGSCGRCGKTCAEDEVCSGGHCESYCEDGRIECDRACYDLEVDDDHCGACGHACPSDAHCVRGDCVGTCAVGSGDCDGDGRCESTFATDAANCGACGIPCDPGDECVNGLCTDVVVGGPACTDSCELATPSECGPGKTCDVVGCVDDTGQVAINVCRPVGASGQGGSCHQSADCAADHTCALASCHELCRADLACGEGSRCIGEDVGICSDHCDPLAPTDGCPLEGRGGCQVFPARSIAGTEPVAAALCYPNGDLPTAAECTGDPNACQPGDTCIVNDPNGAAHCFHYCRVDAPACPGDRTCLALEELYGVPVALDGVTYGICVRPAAVQDLRAPVLPSLPFPSLR